MQWKTSGLGKKHGGLYILQQSYSDQLSVPFQLSTFPPTVLSHPDVYFSQASLIDSLCFVFCNNVDVINKSFLWHNRLGHPSLLKMHSITTSASNVSFSISDFPICIVCPIAKQKRFPFPNENYVCLSVFDLIHCDI